MLEDMVTFLVHRGFEPDWILSRSLASIGALYSSAMRATYLERSEHFATTAETIIQVMDGKKSKMPLTKRLKQWAKIVEVPSDAPAEKTNDAAAFLGAFKRGFR